MSNLEPTGLILGRRAVSLLAAGALVLSGCVSPTAGPGGKYAAPIGNAPVTANPTPYSAALVCLGEYARAAADSRRRASPSAASPTTPARKNPTARAAS